MGRHRLQHLVREVTRHGAVVWYFRKGQGKRIRIKAQYGTPEFSAQYQAALTNQPAPPKASSIYQNGTLEWLWSRYNDSLAWSQLAPATQRQRENVMKRIMAAEPNLLVADITEEHIRGGIDRRKDRLGAARHFLETFRGMFKWAKEANLVRVDPTTKVKTPRDKKATGFHVWTEEECQRYEAHWPRGTWERLAFDVLLYTGLRRGDVVRVGRQHIKDGLIVIKTEKTGEMAYIPVLPQLTEALAEGPTGDLTFIAGMNGRNISKESFGNMFRKACQKAGVPGSAHGLRKAMTNRVAHFLTDAELEAMFGWERGSRVTPIYTDKVVRERLGRTAAAKLKT